MVAVLGCSPLCCTKAMAYVAGLYRRVVQKSILSSHELYSLHIVSDSKAQTGGTALDATVCGSLHWVTAMDPDGDKAGSASDLA